MPETTLAGRVVAIDPGHGGQDAGVVSPSGRKEKELTLACGLRLAELLRAEGCRVVMTRESDHVPLYVRTDAAETAAADYIVSLHFNGNENPAAAGAVTYYFQRSHYYSEHGARLSDYIGAEVGRLSAAGFIRGVGRNFALLREPTGIAVMVEPFFMTNPADDAAAGRADYVERLAGAVVTGLTRYLARA